MKVITRQLASFPCKGCGATLLIHDRERALTCSLCNTSNKAPKRLVDDLELGRKLPFDAEREVQRALDEVLESRYQGFQLARPWVLLAGVLGAVFFSGVYHATAQEPAWFHYLQGALLGFFALALPIGWTASMMETTGLGRASMRITEALRQQPKQCPKCEQPIAPPPMPGRFDCCMCKASLLITPELVIVDDGPRLPRFVSAANTLLEGQPWLDERAGTRGQKLGLFAVAVAVTTCLYLVLSL